jgi:DNA-binding transcriptional ArsR family regulator
MRSVCRRSNTASTPRPQERSPLPRKKKAAKKKQPAAVDQSIAVTAGLIHALRHPVRVQILELLAQRPGSSTTISKALGRDLGVVSYHLNKVLDKQARIVRVVSRRQVRGAVEVFYEVDRQAILSGFNWPKIPEPFAAGLEASGLLAFQKIAVAALEAEGHSERDRMLSWRPAPLDEDGWDEVRAAVVQTQQKIDAAVERSALRLASPGAGSAIHTIVGAAMFEAAPPPSEAA